MAASLRVTLRAAREIARADGWWKQHRPASPLAFENDLAAAFDLLCRQPSIGAKVANRNGSDIRRLHLSRIRYFVFYRIEGHGLVILSLWHSSPGQVPIV